MSSRTVQPRSHMFLFPSLTFSHRKLLKQVSNWSTYNMCTVYCVKLHWTCGVGGGRTVRHILVLTIEDSGTRYSKILHFFIIYLPRRSFISSVVRSTWCLQKDGGWLVIRVH